jgi:hypothetical protein
MRVTAKKWLYGFWLKRTYGVKPMPVRDTPQITDYRREIAITT